MSELQPWQVDHQPFAPPVPAIWFRDPFSKSRWHVAGKYVSMPQKFGTTIWSVLSRCGTISGWLNMFLRSRPPQWSDCPPVEDRCKLCVKIVGKIVPDSDGGL